MNSTSLIQTGVDRLVDLIQAKHRISFTDAAKELGVSKNVIEEWSNFLEEEGIISVEYTFTTPYLTEKKLTKKEIKKKGKEFHGQKDAFVRKVDSTMNSIEASTAGLDKMREQFDKLKTKLGTEIESVRGELEELKHYEDLKKGIDQEMMKQRQEFQDKIAEINNQILSEQKKYQDLLDQVDAGSQKLEGKRVEIVTITEQERKLEENLQKLTESMRGFHEQVVKDKAQVILEEKHIDNLKKLSNKIGKEIKEKKANLPSIIAESKKHEEKIIEAHQKILEKLSTRSHKMDTRIRKGEDVYNKFKDFFEKKRDIQTLIAKITQDKLMLENELKDLVKKAIAFEVSAKTGTMQQHIKDMQDKLEHIEKKKSFLQRELESLRDLMAGDKEDNLKDLENYVRSSFGKNQEQKEIRAKLLASGWDRKIIDDVMKKVR
ncbi:MAG: hypothetical protein ABIH34_06580 [Nanoarchaeota archaeon]